MDKARLRVVSPRQHIIDAKHAIEDVASGLVEEEQDFLDPRTKTELVENKQSGDTSAVEVQPTVVSAPLRRPDQAQLPEDGDPALKRTGTCIAAGRLELFDGQSFTILIEVAVSLVDGLRPLEHRRVADDSTSVVRHRGDEGAKPFEKGILGLLVVIVIREQMLFCHDIKATFGLFHDCTP
ncbi:hypothetical protein [Parasphingorhabdus pacifica]